MLECIGERKLEGKLSIKKIVLDLHNYESYIKIKK